MQEDIRNIQARIAGNDEKALAELYVLYRKKLEQFSKALVRSAETAEEVVEDVFVKIWINRAELPAIENITVYLYVSVKNRSLNILSRKAHELIAAPFDFLNIEVKDTTANPYDVMVTSEMMKQMQQAIELLPPRCKMIFKLVREDGLKYKEIAEILNISVNTIDAQMAIAVKRICTTMKFKKIPRKPVISLFKKNNGFI